jgi:putative ABC transport system ATP-binding protein
MERLNRELGTTFLLSSHDARVVAHAKRIVTLQDGRVVNDEAVNGSAEATA